MKVVLFCGGLGMRLREYSEKVPKPMVNIGYRPIIWHLMKYYAHYGHKEFILCLGYRGDYFKKYFLEYDECDSNDFTLFEGGRRVQLANNDIMDWTITFVDTGAHSNIGQRLKAVQEHVSGEEVFLANYSDGLTNMVLSEQIEDFHSSGAVASFASIKPNLSYHTVVAAPDGTVEDMQPFSASNMRINGGFFVLRNTIFDYMRDGEELVMEPFYRLIQERKLRAFEYNGFWGCVDTYKDKQTLDDMVDEGDAPWEVWKTRTWEPARSC